MKTTWLTEQDYVAGGAAAMTMKRGIDLGMERTSVSTITPESRLRSLLGCVEDYSS